MFELNDRVAVVTGALGLLGKQHCLALAGAGAHVVVADLDADQTAAFAAEVSEVSGHRAIGVAVDITDKDSLWAARARILAELGRLDILINNAAVNEKFEDPVAAAEESRFENLPLEIWQRSMDVNVTGTFLCCQVLGAQLAEQGSGSIVNIASTYGLVAPDQSIYRKPDGTQAFFKSPAYPTTKGAVIALTRFLAAYWGRQGVRVNTLSPGGVEAGQDRYFLENYSARTPLGRMAAPGDYRGAIIFLASDASAYMTGANLVVDGGWTTW